MHFLGTAWRSSLSIGVALTLLFTSGCAMSDELINDIKAARADNKAIRVDVTPVLKKHIPVGSSWNKSRARLESIDCTCRTRSGSQGKSGAYIYDCKANLAPWYTLGFGDDLQLVVEVLGENVAGIRGELIYRSL